LFPPVMSSALGRIAIVGAGAVGAYYGARLARAGCDVSFLFRSDYDAVRANGLTVSTHSGADQTEKFRIKPVAAFRRTDDIGPVDLVVIGLKATAAGVIPEVVPCLLGEETAILTLQNGLGADESLASQFGARRVLGGLCFVCLNRIAPATVACYHPGSIALGEFGRPAGDRARAIGDAFCRAGVDCRVTDNLTEMRWRKLIWNVPFNGLAITGGGVTTGQILADVGLRAEALSLMTEIQSAARAMGYDVPDEFLQHQIEITAPMGAYKPSSLVDYLDGREVEIEAIWGEPLRRAHALGVATPHLAALYDTLQHRCTRVLD